MESNAERVIFVHAHPDDETITTGGTIATLVDRGAAVTIVTCTRGELGEVIPIDLKHLEGDSERLASQREGELAQALSILGVVDHRFLGMAGARRVGLAERHYTDSGMQWGPNGAEPAAVLAAESFCAADFGEAAADLATVIDLVRPHAVISYDHSGGYGHPDHVRAHQIARRAAEVMGVAFFEISRPTVDAEEPATDAAGFTVDVRAVLSRTREALRAHRTQVTVDGDSFALSSGPSRPIALAETFRRVLPDRVGAPPPVAWIDQPRPVKIVGSVAALAAGALVGGICVVDHQFAPIIAGSPRPIGIVIALSVMVALLVGVRIVFTGRAVVGALALGLLGTIALFSTESSGGSILIPANLPGYLLIYVPPVLAIIVLAWPKVGRSARDKLVL